MTMVGERPRVVPGDRWDRFEVDDVVRGARAWSTERVPYLYRDASTLGVPEVTAWVDELVTAAVEAPVGYPAVRHGRSLVLLGLTGTGKTHVSFGAMWELAGSGVFVRWEALTGSDLFAQLRPRHGVDSEEVFQRLASVGVLVVDDIGAHKGSEWTDEQLTRLINHRYQDYRPTIYISNLPPERTDGRPGFDDVVGERVVSRLAECATEVVVGGQDRRRQGGGAR